MIHDPSFVREVLSYEIARKYLPASRANFANLYVNETLIGLYTNVEAVDALFVKAHWGSDRNSFFKGEPLKLEYPFGQNANLALTHGSDSSGYLPFYNMVSVTGWNDLFDLINRLDRGADSAESILNIDRTLWMHAFNEVLLNLDSYIGYAQNYYLYRDDNSQFSPIPWDLNMSFGSFRDSDGSTNFLGISIPKLKRLDPLALMKFSISPRPLMTNLFSNDTLRKIYFAHMRTIVDENFRNGWYFTRAQELRSLIDADVLRDTNRFYSYVDFLANLTVTVGGSGSMIEYPGIKDLMEARVTYLDTRPGFSGQPVISEVKCTPEVPVRGEPCTITARIAGSDLAYIGYRFASNGKFARMTMTDDGNHQDGNAGDGLFGAILTIAGHTLQYYLYAENDSAGVLSPERAEYEFYTVQPAILPGDVVMNEVMAAGYDSWIELLNTTTEPLKVNGMAISYDPVSSVRWNLPDTVIGVIGYYVFNPYSDMGVTQPGTFPLSAAGGTLALVNSGGFPVDSLAYGQQVPGKTTGRYPNGYGPVTFMPPTGGSHNRIGTTPPSGFLLYPNPARETVYLETGCCQGPMTVTIYSATGVMVMKREYFCRQETVPEAFPVGTSQFGSGLYLIRVSGNGETTSQKLIIY